MPTSNVEYVGLASVPTEVRQNNPMPGVPSGKSCEHCRRQRKKVSSRLGAYIGVRRQHLLMA